MANTYDLGDVTFITGTFTQNGSAIDPSGVTLQVRTPDGVLSEYVYGTDPEVEKTGTGAYRLPWEIEQIGEHWYRWVSTGTGQAAEEGYFTVRRRRTR